jgi:hypothetical protein
MHLGNLIVYVPFENGKLLYQDEAAFYLLASDKITIAFTELNQHRHSPATNYAYDPTTQYIYLNNGNNTIDRFHVIDNRYELDIVERSDMLDVDFHSTVLIDNTLYFISNEAIFSFDQNQLNEHYLAKDGQYLNYYARQGPYEYIASTTGLIQIDNKSQSQQVLESTNVNAISAHKDALFWDTGCQFVLLRNNQQTTFDKAKCNQSLIFQTQTQDGVVFFNGGTFNFLHWETGNVETIGKTRLNITRLMSVDNIVYAQHQDGLIMFSKGLFTSRYNREKPSGKSFLFQHVLIDSNGYTYIAEKNAISILDAEHQIIDYIGHYNHPDFQTDFISEIALSDDETTLRIFGEQVWEYALVAKTLSAVELGIDYTRVHVINDNELFYHNQEGVSVWENGTSRFISHNTNFMLHYDRKSQRHQVHIDEANTIIYTQGEQAFPIVLDDFVVPEQYFTVLYAQERLWFLQGNTLRVVDVTHPTRPVLLPLNTQANIIRLELAQSGYLYIVADSSVYRIHPNTLDVQALSNAPVAPKRLPLHFIETEQGLVTFAVQEDIEYPRTLPSLNLDNSVSVLSYTVQNQVGQSQRLYYGDITLGVGESLVGLTLHQSPDSFVSMDIEVQVGDDIFHADNQVVRLPGIQPEALTIRAKLLWDDQFSFVVPVNSPSMLLDRNVQIGMFSLVTLVIIGILTITIKRYQREIKSRNAQLHYIQHIADQHQKIMCVVNKGAIVFANTHFKQRFGDITQLVPAREHDLAVFNDFLSQTNTTRSMRLTFDQNGEAHTYFVERDVVDQDTLCVAFSPIGHINTLTIDHHLQIKQCIARMQYKSDDNAFILLRIDDADVLMRTHLVNKLNANINNYSLSLPFSMMYHNDIGIIVEYRNSHELLAIICDIQRQFANTEYPYHIAVIERINDLDATAVLTRADVLINTQQTICVEDESLLNSLNRYQHHLPEQTIEKPLRVSPLYQRKTLALEGCMLKPARTLSLDTYPEFTHAPIIRDITRQIELLALQHMHSMHIMLPIPITRMANEIQASFFTMLQNMNVSEIVLYLPRNLRYSESDAMTLAEYDIKLGLHVSDLAMRDVQIRADNVYVVADETLTDNLQLVMYQTNNLGMRLIVHNVKNPHNDDYRAYSCYALEGEGLTGKCDDPSNFPSHCDAITKVSRTIKIE